MKVRLSVSENRFHEIKTELCDHGIDIDDDADLELIERFGQAEFLNVKNDVGDRMRIPVDDIVFIESFGRNMDVHTEQEAGNQRNHHKRHDALRVDGIMDVGTTCFCCLIGHEHESFETVKDRTESMQLTTFLERWLDFI